jgi:hypothetical protein
LPTTCAAIAHRHEHVDDQPLKPLGRHRPHACQQLIGERIAKLLVRCVQLLVGRDLRTQVPHFGDITRASVIRGLDPLCCECLVLLKLLEERIVYARRVLFERLDAARGDLDSTSC